MIFIVTCWISIQNQNALLMISDQEKIGGKKNQRKKTSEMWQNYSIKKKEICGIV